MSHQSRIDLFGILCMLSGWAFGYIHCWRNHQERLKDARERAENAYRRYWNNQDGDIF